MPDVKDKCGNEQTVDSAVNFSHRLFTHSRRYIASNAISCGTFDIVYAVIHPQVLFPAPIIVGGGIFKDKVVPDFLARLGISAMLIPIGGLVGSVLAMVVFRYVRLT